MPIKVDVESRKYQVVALGALAACAIFSAVTISPVALYVAPRIPATQDVAHVGTAPLAGRPKMRAPVTYSVIDARPKRFADEPVMQNLGSEPVSFKLMFESVAGLAGLFGAAVFAFRHSW